MTVTHEAKPKRRWRKPFPTLRAFFDQTGTRQSDIAANLGISDTHMSNIVNGKRKPSLDLARALSAETNVPIEAIGADAA